MGLAHKYATQRRAQQHHDDLETAVRQNLSRADKFAQQASGQHYTPVGREQDDFQPGAQESEDEGSDVDREEVKQAAPKRRRKRHTEKLELPDGSLQSVINSPAKLIRAANDVRGATEILNRTLTHYYNVATERRESLGDHYNRQAFIEGASRMINAAMDKLYRVSVGSKHANEGAQAMLEFIRKLDE